MEETDTEKFSVKDYLSGCFITRRDFLEVERLTLQKYLRSKVDVEDWHGVADAAMDLRDCDAALLEISRLEKDINSVVS